LTARFITEPDRSFGDALWRGIFHSVSAFCNAGFDLFGADAHGLASLGAYRDDWLVMGTISALIIIGGLGFAVCLELGHRWRVRNQTRRQPFSLHTRLVLTMSFALTTLGMLAILVTEWTNSQTLGELGVPQKLLTAFFQSVTLRTAGFASVDFNNLRSITLLIMGLFMFIGASPGGTGGGIKTTTVAAMLATVRATLRNQPDAELFNRAVPQEVVFRAIVLILMAFGIVVSGIFVLTFTEPLAMREAGVRDNLFMKLQFEVLSAFGTVGLSTGITPALSEPGRFVIMVLMFLGRLGPTAVTTVLASTGKPLKRRLPQESLSLG
jgi:trk system potassium uptake protein TrkH